MHIAFAAELLATIATDLAADRNQARRLVARLQVDGGLPPAALGREVLHSGRLLGLPAELAVEVHPRLILVFAGGEAITLWDPGDDGRLAVACQIGLPVVAGHGAGGQPFRTPHRPPSIVQIDGLATGRRQPPSCS